MACLYIITLLTIPYNIKLRPAGAAELPGKRDAGHTGHIYIQQIEVKFRARFDALRQVDGQ